MDCTITADSLADPVEVLSLYESVGWTSYLAAPDTLMAGLAGSWLVLGARDRSGRLIGLARVVGDGHTIAYLQDILVDPAAQRTGVGGALLDEVIARTAAIRQLVLLTDAEPGQRAFYGSRGFTEVHDHPAGLRSFVRLA